MKTYGGVDIELQDLITLTISTTSYSATAFVPFISSFLHANNSCLLQITIEFRHFFVFLFHIIGESNFSSLVCCLFFVAMCCRLSLCCCLLFVVCLLYATVSSLLSVCCLLPVCCMLLSVVCCQSIVCCLLLSYATVSCHIALLV
jgi:hypothetical protein